MTEFLLSSNTTIEDYISIADYDVEKLYNVDHLDVSETISELSYLTHDYFRYYGKFPSKVAKYIIHSLSAAKQIHEGKDFIFDNYNGSGTTMVEAKLADFYSAGIDINPFGVLAANVKTCNYDVIILEKQFSSLLEKIKSLNLQGENVDLFPAQMSSPSEQSAIDSVLKKIYVEFPDVEKWFEDDAILQLSAIKYYILQMPLSCYRNFFTLAFFAIIRRVSKAYDAEVRPHVNHSKKKRDVILAFEKKVSEMIKTMRSWNYATDKTVISQTQICNNKNYQEVTSFINKIKSEYHKELGLVISHPPYLNCFDYIPVYRLKFLWSYGFDEIYDNYSYSQIKQEEIKSYPASRPQLIYNYFSHNKTAYQIIFDNLRQGGFCCVVIGDCTINKRLFSVHKILIKMMESIGFIVEKVTYRGTAYGLGRYAYSHKADYNDKSGGKQDAIIFFRKP